MTAPVLQCTGLSRRFGALRAVDGVDLAVHLGARHALIGPNGAGKSTLLTLIAGALRPSAGSVHVEGRDVTKLSEAKRARRGVGQTFQHSSLFLSMSAASNVALAAQRRLGRPTSLLPRAQREVREEVGRRLDEVGLGTRGDVPVGALSHGERRQLEVAVALACRPRLLLLDEPAAGMSPAESDRLATLLEGLPGEVTVLFVEHDLDLVFRLATAVTVLHLGQVLLDGSPAEVRASEAVAEAYLGTGRREELFLPPTTGGAGVPRGA